MSDKLNKLFLLPAMLDCGLLLKPILVIALIVASTDSTLATSRMGEVDVRDEGGVPCFGISKKEELRAGVPMLSSLKVYDVTAKPGSVVWSFELRPSGKSQPIPSNTCIRYGQAPRGFDIGNAEIPLGIGKVYAVEFGATPQDATDPTFGYDAKFCLISRPDGGVRVHQIIFDHGWQYDACKR